MSRHDDERAKALNAIGQKPVSAGDRVAQIQALQELQRQQLQAEAAVAAPPPTSGEPSSGPPLGSPRPAEATSRGVGHGIPDGFKADALAPPLPPISAPEPRGAAQWASYAARQASPLALFGGPNPELLLVGNPWRIINFGDPTAAAALFDLDGGPGRHQLVVPESALSTPQGFLFEVGIAPRGTAPQQAALALSQKRAVLLDAQGRIAGAECASSRDAARLLAGAPWNLPGAARREGARWTVGSAPGGAAYPYQLTVDRPGAASERFAVNNLGQLVEPSRGRMPVVDLAAYWKDAFDSARLPPLVL